MNASGTGSLVDVKRNTYHYCSVVPEKIATHGSTIQWKTRQVSFPTGMGALALG